MKSIYLAILASIICINGLYAQVGAIKSASSDNSSRSSKRDNTSSDSYSSDNYDNNDGGMGFLFGGIAEWQRFKTTDYKERYPSMISLEVFLQGAIKPSSYYILWPRIRGNWGLFSTDFRMNYLIEEGLDGYEHIRTNDWQVLMLNLVTSRFITFRAGTGFMHEAFSTNRVFYESAFILNVHAPDQTKQIGFEYRFAKDFDTGSNPRREFTVQYQHQIFNTGAMHGYATAGAAYQRYYNSITVWGIQAGLIFRFF